MGQLSPDGHWQWDGWRWVPARPLGPPPSRAGRRIPTIWTRRLQILLLVVAGWGLLSALITAALLPSEFGRLEAAIVAQWRQQGIPAGEISSIQRSLPGLLVIVIVLIVAWSLGFCALQVVGTLRRWVWWYWVQFAICCLAALSLLITVGDMVALLATAAGGGPPTLTTYRVPLTLSGDLLNVGAGICMLIAAVRIGPWAMTRDPALPWGG